MIWRPLRDGDLDAVEHLAETIHPDHPERPEVFAERLRLAPDCCFLLEDRAPAGYLIAHPWAGGPVPLDTLLGALPSRVDHLYIHDLALAPAARGRGHAAAILARLPGPAALVSLGASVRFWARHGFAVTPLDPAKLAGYGPGAAYMTRDG